MLYDNTDYSNLIKFSKDGLYIADYTEIRSIITNRYKQIYGYDIDLSTGTADGQFIEMISLMLNNILLTTKQMYVNLDANLAQGKMLDIISSLTNVQRRQATYSRASITVTSISGDVSLTELDVIDKNGTIWSWSSDTAVTFEEDVPQQITVQCSEVGPVKAPAGWITSTALNLAMIVQQSSDAVVGQDVETDEHLRARRNNSLASSGLTTLEAMKASLLNLSGIEDVLIYNNSDNTDGLTTKDGTSVPLHEIYVCIRKNSSIDVSDTTIGSMIYEKITPGIRACQSAISADRKSYNYITGSNITQTVRWRQCTPVHPGIAISITSIDHYDSANTPDVIKEALIKYCNGLPLSTNLLSQDLFMKTIYADPKFKGQPTYIVNSVTVNASTSYTNPDTYYDFSNADITITDTNA